MNIIGLQSPDKVWTSTELRRSTHDSVFAFLAVTGFLTESFIAKFELACDGGRFRTQVC